MSLAIHACFRKEELSKLQPYLNFEIVIQRNDDI